MTTRRNNLTQNVLPIKNARNNKTLEFTLDLDSLYGHMPFDVFKVSFKPNIHLQIDNSARRVHIRSNVIKTDYLLRQSNRELIKIKQLPHMRIGTVTATEFGKLDIYLALSDFELNSNEMKSLVYSEIKQSMIENKTRLCTFAEIQSLDKKTQSETNAESLVCELSCNVFCNLFEHLIYHKFKNNSPVIYFETFGNKRSMITNDLNFNVLKNRICSAFEITGHEFLHVDVCISSSYGSGTVTLANESFFENVKLTPNYILMFSNTVLNFYKSTIDTKTGIPKQTGVFTNVYKLNFYSTFKYAFDFDSNKNYVFPMSFSLMLTNFYGHRIFSRANKFNLIYDKYNNFNDRIEADVNNGTCLYRTELRCKLEHAEEVLEHLKLFLIDTNFSYYESKPFNDLLQTNINNMLSIIKYPNGFDGAITPTSLIISFLTEYILKTLYLTGSIQNSIIPESSRIFIMKKIGMSKNSLTVLENLKEIVQNVYTQLETDGRLKLITTQVDYLLPANDLRKPLLKKLIQRAFNLDGSDSDLLHETLLVYLQEKTGDMHDDFKLLQNPLNHGKKQGIMVALKRIFILKDLNRQSTVTKIFFSMYILKNKTNIVDALEKMADLFKLNNIISVFVNNTFKDFTRINLNYCRMNTSKKLKTNNKSRSNKDILLEQFVQACNVKHSIKNPDENELVRYLNALYRHTTSPSRPSCLMNDFAYSIYPVRDMNWVKNRMFFLKKLLLNTKIEFDRVIKRVIEWSPDEFTLKDRLDHLENHSIELDVELLSLYEKLVTNDVQEWWADSFRDHFKTESSYDIFYKIVKQTKTYISTHSLVRQYSKYSIDDLNIPKTLHLQNIEQNVLTQPVPVDAKDDAIYTSADSEDLNELNNVEMNDYSYDSIEFNIQGDLVSTEIEDVQQENTEKENSQSQYDKNVSNSNKISTCITNLVNLEGLTFITDNEQNNRNRKCKIVVPLPFINEVKSTANDIFKNHNIINADIKNKPSQTFNTLYDNKEKENVLTSTLNTKKVDQVLRINYSNDSSGLSCIRKPEVDLTTTDITKVSNNSKKSIRSKEEKTKLIREFKRFICQSGSENVNDYRFYDNKISNCTNSLEDGFEFKKKQDIYLCDHNEQTSTNDNPSPIFYDFNTDKTKEYKEIKSKVVLCLPPPKIHEELLDITKDLDKKVLSTTNNIHNNKVDIKTSYVNESQDFALYREYKQKILEKIGYRSFTESELRRASTDHCTKNLQIDRQKFFKFLIFNDLISSDIANKTVNVYGQKFRFNLQIRGANIYLSNSFMHIKIIKEILRSKKKYITVTGMLKKMSSKMRPDKNDLKRYFEALEIEKILKVNKTTTTITYYSLNK